MKIIRFYTLFICMAVLLLLSCSEETVTGPQGETGETGPMGPQGIPGKDGSLILFGNGAPAESLGKDGDMYLDRAGSELYGAKTDSNWGTPLQLKGEKGDQGDAGEPGSQFLSDAVDPSTGQGAEGDYFLNQESGDLFGPKSASGWGTPINLKGTANVVASTWINLKPWTNTSVSYLCEATYSIPSPILNAVGYSSLTSMSASGGVLLVYLSINGAWTNQLPYTDITSNWHARWYLRDNAGFNYFYLNIRRLSGTTALPEDIRDLTGNYKLRYVLIPAGLQLSAKNNGRDVVDIKALQQMGYNEVKELLGFSD